MFSVLKSNRKKVLWTIFRVFHFRDDGVEEENFLARPKKLFEGYVFQI
jgi:hypothetical protein